MPLTKKTVKLPAPFGQHQVGGPDGDDKTTGLPTSPACQAASCRLPCARYSALWAHLWSYVSPAMELMLWSISPSRISLSLSRPPGHRDGTRRFTSSPFNCDFWKLRSQTTKIIWDLRFWEPSRRKWLQPGRGAQLCGACTFSAISNNCSLEFRVKPFSELSLSLKLQYLSKASKIHYSLSCKLYWAWGVEFKAPWNGP